MSVVKPVHQRFEPEDLAPRLSQELPSQAIGPWTRCATSVNGWRAILAPSNAQPPAAPPGSSCLVQPFFRSASDLFLFLAQPGSLNTPWIVAESELIHLSCRKSALTRGPRRRQLELVLPKPHRRARTRATAERSSSRPHP